jgi:L-arabinokinase
MSGDLAAFRDAVAASGSAALAHGPGPRATGSAPGRLDLMGGIADYSGALVLQWPIAERTRATIRRHERPHLRIASRDPDGRVRVADVPAEPVCDPAVTYAELRRLLADESDTPWAAYVAGVLAVLVRDEGLRFTGGADIVVESDVPEGKGVSSSAALEAAVLAALVQVEQLMLEPRRAALLCQRAENLVVGAPCGVMDQMAVIAGRRGHLLALLCQPAELQGHVPLPRGLAVFGIDSGIRHAVSGSDYTAVRVGAFMGYRVIADLAGLPVRAGERPGHVRVEDARWQGYLANVGSEAFGTYDAHVPNTLTGSVFLKRYGGTTDPVTTIDRDRCYAIWTPTAHPVYEHERVGEFARLLRDLDPDDGAPPRAVCERLGALMYASHASYSRCGLGSEGTDLLVELARAAGPEAGIYGAKITGGGSGGTVALLASPASAPRVRAIARDYAARTGREPVVFAGSSESVWESGGFGPGPGPGPQRRADREA